MKSTGVSPTAKRIMATCGPESRAVASFAEKAMRPKKVADAVMSSSARCVGVVFIKLRGMITYRDAARNDRDTIVAFQIAMARETEDVALDRDICTRGVDAVFDDLSRGRYFVADENGEV